MHSTLINLVWLSKVRARSVKWQNSPIILPPQIFSFKSQWVHQYPFKCQTPTWKSGNRIVNYFWNPIWKDLGWKRYIAPRWSLRPPLIFVSKINQGDLQYFRIRNPVNQDKLASPAGFEPASPAWKAGVLGQARRWGRSIYWKKKVKKWAAKGSNLRPLD